MNLCSFFIRSIEAFVPGPAHMGRWSSFSFSFENFPRQSSYSPVR